MNKSIQYINQNYHQYINDHIFVNSETKSHIKKGYLIKAIDKRNLELKLNGKILGFDSNYNFIRSYNLIDRRCLTIYLDQFYIFIKKIDNKDDIFKKRMLSFIKKIEKNHIK